MYNQSFRARFRSNVFIFCALSPIFIHSEKKIAEHLCVCARSLEPVRRVVSKCVWVLNRTALFREFSLNKTSSREWKQITIQLERHVAISVNQQFLLTLKLLFQAPLLFPSRTHTFSLYLFLSLALCPCTCSLHNVKIPSLWFCFLFFTDEHMAARVVSSITSSASKKRLPGKLTRSQSLAFNCPSLLFKWTARTHAHTHISTVTALQLCALGVGVNKSNFQLLLFYFCLFCLVF